MEDKIKTGFLGKQRLFAEKYLKCAEEKMQAEFKANKPSHCRKFSDSIDLLLKKYRALQEQDIVADPQYFQISLLRTGILTHSAPYRIDLYDARWLVSPVECCVPWNPEFVYRHFYRLAGELYQRFRCQSRVKEYEADKILMEISQAFHLEATSFLIDILEEHFADKVYAEFYRKNKIKFYEGEFFDRFFLLYDWEKA